MSENIPFEKEFYYAHFDTIEEAYQWTEAKRDLLSDAGFEVTKLSVYQGNDFYVAEIEASRGSSMWGDGYLD